jgi:hypothetical protein
MLTVVKLELAEIGKSATVMPVRMCSEPTPVELRNFLQCVGHRNIALLWGGVWPAGESEPAT